MSGPVLSSLTIRTGWKKQWPARRPSLSAEPMASNKAKRQWSAVRSRWTVEQTNPIPGTTGRPKLGRRGRWTMNERSQFRGVSGNGREPARGVGPHRAQLNKRTQSAGGTPVVPAFHHSNPCLSCETNPIVPTWHNGQVLGAKGVMTNQTDTGPWKNKANLRADGDGAGSVEPPASAVGGVYCAKRSQSGAGRWYKQSQSAEMLSRQTKPIASRRLGRQGGRAHRLGESHQTKPIGPDNERLRTDSPLKSEAPGRYTGGWSVCTAHPTCND